ncbi:IS5 family transposase [Amycolatopsis sp. Hca4]|nr:IS5 family transposase [Amycolatopsis sp. Hca4]QKV76257.1 IS5 family transposase [Amycolatopsis sp. Hca4]QKV78248.1 IS5 family transposase [Amycolatopsis sp. Hca4]QKV78934.1 IS5 family transposase [Amycolatopsis sp. Hca4]QKV79238.1 IS5 family transposase [Amycolatopsis sp. Hca4]
MVRRHELTDEQWQVIQPLLPVSGAKGRPRVDDRRVINGMLFKAKTGVAWRDLPERYGPWKTVYNRFWRWSRTGTLSALVAQVRVIAEAIDELDREVSVDSSIVRAHQHAAGARRATASHTGGERILRRANEPGDHAIGRSRGGPTTKIHLACDGHGRPLSIVLTGGNVNDCTQFIQVMAGIEFRRPGPGRPATRPSRVLADKGYSSRAIRSYLRRRRIPATIPERRDQQANRRRRGRAGGRPPAFDRTAYRRRNIVERCFNRLKQFRAIATRFDKTATSYRSMIDLATLLLWL